MPHVQLSSLIASTEIEIVEYAKTIKSNAIDACLKEVRDMTNIFSIPTKQELLEASTDNELTWNAIRSFRKNPIQPEDSYQEQKLAITTCIDAIDQYRDPLSSDTYTKNVGIRGFPGGGKTWCMQYCQLYAISKGLKVITTAMMCKRALHLGGKHVHHLFLLPPDDNLTPHRRAELAILDLLKIPKLMDFLRTVNIIFFDEMGQVSAEYLSTFDIILRKIRNSNVYMGGSLLIFSMDHTQLQPIRGHPFLTSCHVIPCFKFVNLNHSVRASSDVHFQRIQEIARYNYQRFTNESELVDEFIDLCTEYLTFVDKWDDNKITPSTMRLYSKKVPAKDASRQFIARVRRQVSENDRIERNAEDIEKNRYSHQEWITASENTSTKLEQKVKEPKTLLFFKGAIFECTFNKEGKFSNTQKVLLYDLPSQETLNNWQPIKVLLSPVGLQDIEYDPDKLKESYISQGFTEIEVGLKPDRIQLLANNVQAKRKQYGLKHHVTSTIHAAMGDTLQTMATEVSLSNGNFKMWDKGQMIVILSRTKKAKDTIFVGDKNDTIAALKALLTQKTQWTDYMEEVLALTTINADTSVGPGQIRRVFTPSTFPYRIKDSPLPQCNTGYVYMLMSIKDMNFTYIGKTKCIRTRIQKHNSGVGAVDTEPLHLRPYAMFAYICGFNSQSDLLFYIEDAWKQKRDQMIRNGVNDAKAWALGGEEVINGLDEDNFGVKPSDLTLVCLFNT